MSYSSPKYSWADELRERRVQPRSLSHESFREIWKKELNESTSEVIRKETCWVEYGDMKEVYLCSDLSPIIALMDKELDEKEEDGESKDAKEICIQIFKNESKKFKRINLERGARKKREKLWYNKTKNGINLRPGLLEESSKLPLKLPPAITLRGEESHAVVVGRTGSGKSVFLNNIILNLIMEYSPWELELYLADFKKVELSRYMLSYPTPHVRACAATSEIRYVLSLIHYIKKYKDERETFFSRLGIQKIDDFRELYPNIVMPRILFVIDEFQQMFLDATQKQAAEISDLLTDITRRGRAAGVHLLFASQEMKGTGIQLTNFKVRFALPCDGDVSISILGNAAAQDLEQYHVIMNSKSGKREENVVYKVPFIPSDKNYDGDDEGKELSYFDQVRKKIYVEAHFFEYSYEREQKFYRENEQKKIESLSKFLTKNPIMNTREKIANISGRPVILPLVLGRSVVYNRQEYDIENILIESGKNKCFLGISTSNIDIAYMQKLLAINFKTCSIALSEKERGNMLLSGLNPNNKYIHYYISLNPVVSNMYRIESDLSTEEHKIWRINRVDELSKVFNAFDIRREQIKLLRSQCTVIEYCEQNYIFASLRNGKGKSSHLEDPLYKEVMDTVKTIGENIEQIPFLCKKLSIEYNKNPSNEHIFMVRGYLSEYYRYHVLKISERNLFPPCIVWFSGIENIERISNELRKFSRDCTDVNMYCLFFSSIKVQPEINMASNYIVVGGSDKELYNYYIGYVAERKSDSITLECHVKSLSKSFAFKKYRASFSEDYCSSLDFDHIIKEL